MTDFTFGEILLWLFPPGHDRFVQAEPFEAVALALRERFSASMDGPSALMLDAGERT